MGKEELESLYGLLLKFESHYEDIYGDSGFDAVEDTLDLINLARQTKLT